MSPHGGGAGRLHAGRPCADDDDPLRSVDRLQLSPRLLPAGDGVVKERERDVPARVLGLGAELNGLLEARQADVAPGDHLRRGYGLACAWWSTLGTPSAATVELHEDGTATLSSGGTEIGTGAISTALPSMVAEELGLRPDRVVLKSGSTRDAPYDSGSRGSHTMFATGNATVLAARAVAEQIRNEASRLLESTRPTWCSAKGVSRSRAHRRPA
ncbi:molybdopterin-dependent oxidoreductase [Streptomyces sp. ME02-8801-2C]|uniref:molybdopterin cofactor-binding domain-containing protein n=1 Tax=Streptomyces sp. ME02-8801-2C TaxID=3028680 RepID=UPI0029B28BA0|nr:molybdopterin cofactor-binding domain-containing protein [Streptomyces sp. ME02-8801-2C]MDX3452548.1 molybdopterin-dependent oxidoreductase [Streptomyces sp. ME02-8801-2C]